MAVFGEVPPDLKCIQHYMKIAAEHENRNPIITYWCRFYAIQAGLKVGSKSKESSTYLFSIMDWLEKEKKKNPENEAITNDVVAQATIENYALKLFNWADGEDRACKWNKNVVKAFYTAGFIYDISDIFGEPSEEVAHHRKYAKWKSTYIHNCLKSGTTPIPGPVAMEGKDEENNYQAEGSDKDNNFPGFSTNPHLTPTPYPTGPVTFPSAGVPEAGLYAPPSTPNGSSEPSPAAPEITYVPPQTSAMKSTQSEDTDIKRAVMQQLSSIMEEAFQNCFQNLQHHWNFCITAEGDYFMRAQHDGVTLTSDHFHKAQKFCKWAGSALQYEDVPTAIENLQKALTLLTTGNCE